MKYNLRIMFPKGYVWCDRCIKWKCKEGKCLCNDPTMKKYKEFSFSCNINPNCKTSMSKEGCICEEVRKRKEKEKQQKWIAERNKEYDDFLEKERKRALSLVSLRQISETRGECREN